MWSKERGREVTAKAGITDLEVYNVLTLSLICNRRCPEFWTDDEVSETLWRILKTHRHLIRFHVPWLPDERD
jgi:hypothetical protein